MQLYSSKKGQGLLEAVIAIGIIITGLLAILTLTTANIMTAGEASSHLLANNLAREGVEAVRIIRDSSWLVNPNQTWYNLVASPSDTTAIAVLDPNTFEWTLDFQVNSLTEAKAAIWRDTNNVFRQSWQSFPVGSLKTKFSRLVTVYPICRAPAPSLDEVSTQVNCQVGWSQIGVRVVSTVAYTERGRDHVLSLEDMLYNWRANLSNYAP